MARWLITGGCGFIGSNLIRLALRTRPDVEIVNFDALTYAGNPRNVEDAARDAGSRYIFRRGSVASPADAKAVFGEHGPFDVVFHLAAESHVDRSIDSAAAFVETNVVGTQVMLDFARQGGLTSHGRFVHISTDEVYGALPLDESAPRFREETPLAPRSPYAASKASSDLMVLAAQHTHGLNAVVTRCSNNYGPYQFPEKLIPLMILRASRGESLPVYGDGLYVRDWIHVDDHCRGLIAAAERGQAGEVYNFGADNERPNIALVKTLLQMLGQPETLIAYVTDRKGHDRRYAVDASKARRELGWQPEVNFEQGLRDTVTWYLDNAEWVKSILTKDYLEYIVAHYG
jgi:dTDP-glucose 4,6-dehydratase